MKKALLFVFILISTLFVRLNAQNIGIGTNTPDKSSILELTSTSQGILIPRMTQAQRVIISAPAQGLAVYQTDLDTGFYFYKGSSWRNLTNNNSINLNLILTSYLNSDSTLALYDYTGLLIRIIQPSQGIDFNTYSIRDAKLSPDGKLIFVSGQSHSVNFGDKVFIMDIYGNNVKTVFTQNAALRYLDVK